MLILFLCPLNNILTESDLKKTKILACSYYQCFINQVLTEQPASQAGLTFGSAIRAQEGKHGEVVGARRITLSNSKLRGRGDHV